MKCEEAQPGMIVRSIKNPNFRYQIVTCFRTCCWLKVLGAPEIADLVYKGVQYQLLYPEEVTP